MTSIDKNTLKPRTGERRKHIDRRMEIRLTDGIVTDRRRSTGQRQDDVLLEPQQQAKQDSKKESE